MRNQWIAGGAAVWLALSLAAVAATKEMSVSVESGDVRATPSGLGKVVGTLKYTTVVDMLEESGSWCKIVTKDGKVTGWIAAKSLAKGRLKLEAGKDVSGGASASETALAGKGFTEQVEKAYKEKNPKVDFAWVDKMLGFKVSQDEVVSFLQLGGIDVTKGGK
jgi:hypothetical protein